MDTRHPHFTALYDHCAAKLAAVEDHPWDHVSFKVRGKLFAIFGQEDPPVMTVKARPDDLDALLALEFIERAPYVGRYGWVTVTVAEPEALDLAFELIDHSYELVAGAGRRSKR